jgi:hypothetical protein
LAYCTIYTDSLTVSTADGTSQVLTVTIAGTNDAAVVSTVSASVSEEGLTNGNIDTTGTPDTTNSTTASGSISITDPDSAVTVTLVAPSEVLTSGGVTVIWAGGGTQTLIGSAGGVEVIRAIIDNSGNYTVTLSKPIDHATAGTEDTKTISFGVSATDGALTTTGSLNVSVEDDAPIANTTTTSVGSSAGNTNLSIVLDLSGSMGNASGITNTTRLEVTVAAIKELIDGYDSLGNVMVNISTFSTTATNGTWMTAANAIALLSNFTAAGNTNYDAALRAAIDSFAAVGKLTATNTQNVLYFLSDGAPTVGDNNTSALLNVDGGATDTGINAAEETLWKNFLTTNSVNAFAFGLGTGVTTANMDPVAYNGVTNTNQNSTVVADLSTLPAALAATVTNSASGSISTGTSGTGSFGADGGYLSQLVYGTHTYNFNGSTLTVVETGSAIHSFNTTTHVLTLTTAAGTYVIDLDDGNYTFTTTAAITVPQEIFNYTLTDNDGDTASGALTINLNGYNSAPVARDESVIVQSTSVISNTVTIKDMWLLWNDSDREGAALSISSVTNATSHIGSQVVDAVTSNNGGTGAFTYLATDGNDTNDAAVTIATQNSTTLTGNGLDNILVGGTGKDTLTGNEGSDVLVGGVGNDALDGGTGRDLLIGGAGNDTMTGGAVGDLTSDTFYWELADAGTVATPAIDTINNFSTLAASAGGDILNIKDLLTGEAANAASLDNYLHFQFSGGNTTIYLSAAGAFSDNNVVGAPPTNVANNDVQQIVLTGVNLVGTFTTDQQVIADLITKQKLITD